MITKHWPVLAAIALVALVAAPAPALAARPSSVTRGLDYLHAQQSLSTGGYFNSQSTAWAALGAVAAGERMGSSAWTHAGHNPITSLQTVDHLTAAAASGNPPVYYSLTILAYMTAANGKSYIYDAGTTSMNLLAQLYSYQDQDSGDTGTYGSFAPGALGQQPDLAKEAVRTTAWAILALHAMDIDNAQVDSAVAWLSDQANADGGFGISPSAASDNVDTALAIQALRSGDVSASSSLIQNALDYLDGQQRAGGGFADQTYTRNVTSADATAYVVQAVDAAGEDPSAGRWVTSGGDSPLDVLRKLQTKQGTFRSEPGELINPVAVTGHVIIALSGVDFATYPLSKPKAVKPFVYRPRFVKVGPKEGVTYRATRIVLIRATYGDGTGGTGIDPDAVRLYVDSADRTKAAVVGRYGLHLELKNVPNGKHTYRIVIADYAGNQCEVDRTFTIAVPVLPTSSPTPTYTPYPPTTYSPTPTLTPTVTPSTTLYPTPVGSATAYPTPTPSSSSTPVTGAPVGNSSSGGGGASSGNGGGSAAGLLGGTLLAMLPLGAALTYYLLHRREEIMAGSAAGESLPGGGSAWERLKSVFVRSKDLVKPARS